MTFTREGRGTLPSLHFLLLPFPLRVRAGQWWIYDSGTVQCSLVMWWVCPHPSVAPPQHSTDTAKANHPPTQPSATPGMHMSVSGRRWFIVLFGKEAGVGYCSNGTQDRYRRWGRWGLDASKEIIPSTCSIFSLSNSSKSFDLINLFIYQAPLL